MSICESIPSLDSDRPMINPLNSPFSIPLFNFLIRFRKFFFPFSFDGELSRLIFLNRRHFYISQMPTLLLRAFKIFLYFKQPFNFFQFPTSFSAHHITKERPPFVQKYSELSLSRPRKSLRNPPFCSLMLYFCFRRLPHLQMFSENPLHFQGRNFRIPQFPKTFIQFCVIKSSWG